MSARFPDRKKYPDWFTPTVEPDPAATTPADGVAAVRVSPPSGGVPLGLGLGGVDGDVTGAAQGGGDGEPRGGTGRHSMSGGIPLGENAFDSGGIALGSRDRHPAFDSAIDPAFTDGGHLDLDELAEDDADDVGLLRPFIVTGGRTRPMTDGLRVESLIRTHSHAAVTTLRFEARQIADLCRRPRSVAEISVSLGMPLGVTKVLVSDLVSQDLVGREETSEISVALLERILERVRAL